MGSCSSKLNSENRLKRRPNKNQYVHIFSDDNNKSPPAILSKIDASNIKQVYSLQNPEANGTILIQTNDGSIYYGKNKYTYFEDNGIIIDKIYIPTNNDNGDRNKSTFWVTNDGELYKGDLRNGTPSKIEIGDITASIIDISSGSKHDIVLCGNGKQSSSLNINDIKHIVSYLYSQNTDSKQIFPEQAITCIHEYCQDTESKFIDTNLYSLGKGEYGQTGQGEGDGEYKTDEELALVAKDWKFINIFKNVTITSISCGEKFTLFLDCNGIIYGCGANGYGQLGLGEMRNYTDSTAPPTIVPYFVENGICITRIECGQRHSLALDKELNIYSWGSNYFKQCGFDEGGEVKIPRMINIFRKYNITKIGAAGCNSYAKSDRDEHVIWGNNEYGQCLDATLCRCCMPAKINNTFHSMTSKQIHNVYMSMNCVIITCKD